MCLVSLFQWKAGDSRLSALLPALRAGAQTEHARFWAQAGGGKTLPIYDRIMAQGGMGIAPRWNVSVKRCAVRQHLAILARMEHERWAAPLWMAGWKPGPRDDTRRIHPNLVPYDELDQGTKNYDIEQVRAVPMYLGLV